MAGISTAAAWSIRLTRGTHESSGERRRYDFPRPARPAPAPRAGTHRQGIPRRRDVDLRFCTGLPDAVLVVPVPAVPDRPDRFPAPAGLLLLAAPAIGTGAATPGAGAGQPGDRPVAAVQGRAAVSRYRNCLVDRIGWCAPDDERDERRLRCARGPPGVEAHSVVDHLYRGHCRHVAGGSGADGAGYPPRSRRRASRTSSAWRRQSPAR